MSPPPPPPEARSIKKMSLLQKTFIHVVIYIVWMLGEGLSDRTILENNVIRIFDYVHVLTFDKLSYLYT